MMETAILILIVLLELSLVFLIMGLLFEVLELKAQLAKIKIIERDDSWSYKQSEPKLTKRIFVKGDIYIPPDDAELARELIIKNNEDLGKETKLSDLVDK